MTTTTARFTGFKPEAIHFLLELSVNNERAWFQPRKSEYERLLKEPLEALCTALAQQFEARLIPLRADPIRSPFRIYRDVRFSKDKSPYKTHVSASFPWASGANDDSSHGMGGYFHFQPDEYYAGGGMWHPERPRLEAWRSLVANAPATVHAAIEDPRFTAAFGAVEGERLVRVPTGWPADHPDAELLRLKDVTFGRELTEDEALSAELPEILADAFSAATPVLELLASLPA
ncbi:MAG: DUF2461 domain-containing protein [Chloroflexota bacterium]|nr:DUF2461 domain-containing protein [Chloroflexota bacterium]